MKDQRAVNIYRKLEKRARKGEQDYEDQDLEETPQDQQDQQEARDPNPKRAADDSEVLPTSKRKKFSEEESQCISSSEERSRHSQSVETFCESKFPGRTAKN